MTHRYNILSSNLGSDIESRLEPSVASLFPIPRLGANIVEWIFYSRKSGEARDPSLKYVPRFSGISLAGTQKCLLIKLRGVGWGGEATSTRDNPNRLRAFLSETSIGLA